MTRNLLLRLARRLLARSPEPAPSVALVETLMAEEGLFPLRDFNPVDVFICGWPKSGNTWCQRLLSGIFWGIDTSVLTDQLAQTLIPDIHFRKFYRRFATPMLWKSHHLPLAEYKRVIHLVRDGRDAFVSYWHMLKHTDPAITMDGMLRMGETLWPCSWEKHSLEWLANPHNSDILRVKYEDLLLDPLPQLRAMASFVGRTRSDERLAEILAGASLDNMRRIAISAGWANDKTQLTRNFFRQGKCETWRNEMPKAIAREFNHRASEALHRLGYSQD